MKIKALEDRSITLVRRYIMPTVKEHGSRNISASLKLGFWKIKNTQIPFCTSNGDKNFYIFHKDDLFVVDARWISELVSASILSEFIVGDQVDWLIFSPWRSTGEWYPLFLQQDDIILLKNRPVLIIKTNFPTIFKCSFLTPFRPP